MGLGSDGGSEKRTDGGTGSWCMQEAYLRGAPGRLTGVGQGNKRRKSGQVVFALSIVECHLGSFCYLFTQQLLLEHLPCARLQGRPWGAPEIKKIG